MDLDSYGSISPTLTAAQLWDGWYKHHLYGCPQSCCNYLCVVLSFICALLNMATVSILRAVLSFCVHRAKCNLPLVKIISDGHFAILLRRVRWGRSH